ncbi:MAG: hypothetical protein IPN44_13625 [Flavobacteriales bacterium]|jgi:hypothetical protein|nr:hypothetical protein [Flavobacteriales bacterium]MCI1752173.1 hypothetical protein [Flavobacteriales bacterium]
MRTLIRSSAFFIIAFWVVALGFDTLLQRWAIFDDPASNPSKVKRLIESEDPEEIPVFGSSKARSSFIPDSLGPTVWNYAMEKCNFDVTEFLMEVELAKPRKGAVLVEFNHRFFVHAPDHTIDAATFVPNIGLPGVREYLERNGRFETRFLVPGLRYFGAVQEFLRKGNSDEEDVEDKNARISEKGGLFTERSASPKLLASQVAARQRSIEMRLKLQSDVGNVKAAVSAEDRYKLKYLDAFLLFSAPKERIERFEELVASRPDRQILVVYTPQHWSEMEGVSNYEEITALFHELEQRHPNLHFYDYSMMKLPDSAFKNSSHLNNQGARAFCTAFKRDAGQYLHAP